MKRVMLGVLVALALGGNARGEIRHVDETGQQFYARVEKNASTFFAVQLTEGSTSRLRNYIATDAQILSAAGTLADNTDGGYFFTVRAGTASTTADDPVVGQGSLLWASNSEAPLGELIGDIEGGGGGGVTIPVNQTRIPPARTWVLRDHGEDGLEGDKTIAVYVGDDPKTFAIDFAADLATNGQLVSVDSVEILEGEAGGVTFDEDFEGVDRSEAKLKITPVTADTYRIAVTVTFDDNDGGGQSTGVVDYVVKER